MDGITITLYNLTPDELTRINGLLKRFEEERRPVDVKRNQDRRREQHHERRP